MILLEFLKRNVPNPSGFRLRDVAKSILPKPRLSLGIPPALAAMPAATAVSELAAAQSVTPTEQDPPSSAPTGESPGALSGGVQVVLQVVNDLSQFSVSIVRDRPTARSQRRTCTAAPYAIEVGRC
jgi:hypothetical protein